MLVVNPRATRVRPEVVATVRRALSPDAPVETVLPADRAAAQAAIRAAADTGVATVAVLGGDGTIGLAAAELAGTGTALLPLPGGSTNVFARGLGWPAVPAALDDCTAAALHAPPRTVHLGSVVTDAGATLACVNVGAGLDAAVVAWVEQHPTVKRRLRQLAFAGAAIGPGLGYLRHAAPLALSVGDGPVIGIHSLVGAWGRPYVYVGSRALDLLPAAGWNGRLAWIATTRGTVRQVAALVGSALWRPGREVAGTVRGVTAEPVTVTSATPFPVQADGEPLGTTRRLVLQPGPTLLVRVPQGSGADGR